MRKLEELIELHGQTDDDNRGGLFLALCDDEEKLLSDHLLKEQQKRQWSNLNQPIEVNQAEPFRQGEAAFYPVEWLKERGLDKHPSFSLEKPVQVKPENGKLIIAHSESMHHHCIDIKRSKNVQLLIDQTNELIGLLKIEGVPVDLEHLRANDTHDTFRISEGDYIVKYHAQETPDGWARVID